MPTRTRAAPQYPDHIGFILAEEDALKVFLEGVVTLPDGQGNEKPVRIFYRYPSPEHANVYPFITIDFVGVEPAYDLWHSDYRLDLHSCVDEDSDTGHFVGTRLYDPSTAKTITPAQPSYPFTRRNYLPYRLFYQLVMWSNNVAHDRIMTARMIRDIIQPHPSWLWVEADGTWRRMEPQGWTAADLPSQEGASKRIFRKVYTISVQAELPQDYLVTIAQAPTIERLRLRLYELRTGSYLTPDETTEYWETLWETPHG